MMDLSVRRDHAGQILYRSHPNGWTIRCRRIEEDRRGWTPRGAFVASGVGPKVYWEVKRARTKGAMPRDFNTLREAREWCDEHKAPEVWVG